MLLHGTIAVALASRFSPASAQSSTPDVSLSIGLPGCVPADGFVVRHGYATENTWFAPENFHTGECW